MEEDDVLDTGPRKKVTRLPVALTDALLPLARELLDLGPEASVEDALATYAKMRKP